MQTSRITLAILAFVSIALTVPALAGQPGSRAPSIIDVGAIPPYPMEDGVKGHRASTQPHQQRVVTSRMRHEAKETNQAIPRPRQAESGVAGSGRVCSGKTGVCVHVAASHSGQFQAYIDDLEQNHGATVYYMGGYRAGPCANYSLHPCGLALDVCQDYRGHVSGHKNCHLPPRAQLALIAANHGLFEGGQWCNSDYGHAQVGVTAAKCGGNLYAAVEGFKRRSAAHHRHHYAKL